MLRDVERRRGHRRASGAGEAAAERAAGGRPSHRSNRRGSLAVPAHRSRPQATRRRDQLHRIVPAPAAPPSPTAGARPAEPRRAARRRPDPGPPGPQRHRGERPPRRRRRGRRQRVAMLRALGDPDRVVNLRSCVKPFGLVALIEAGGIEAFELEPAELAIMASSHSGEDLHVRTLQAMYRRTGVSQAIARLRLRGHAARRADRSPPRPRRREGEPGPAHVLRASTRSSCCCASCKAGTPTATGSTSTRPRSRIGRPSPAAFGTTPGRLRLGIDGCGIPTYAFPLREVARAYAIARGPRRPSRPAIRAPRSRIR